MCETCMKHGTGGKWHLNAASYSEEVARKHNLREFLLEPSTRPPRNPFRPEGHIGQVVPLEDGVAILQSCVAEPLIDKLPRFIPEHSKYHLSRAEAVRRFTEHNQKGYIGTIWYGPYPYINNLRSCAIPECAGIRPRVDEKACYGCGVCRHVCDTQALFLVDRGAA